MRSVFYMMGVILILLGIFGYSYTWSYDHRDAETLEEYATLDLQVSRQEDGSLEGANLSLYDYRYDDAQLQRRAMLYVDGVAWEMVASTRQTQMQFRRENKLFVTLPKSSLQDVLRARQVRLKFYYDNGQTIDLPLGKKELVAWQRKLRW